MSEQEPSQENPEETAEESIYPKDLEKMINQLIDYIRENEDQVGHLQDEDRQELIDGIRDLNILDTRTSDEPEAIDTSLVIDDVVGELFGLFDQYDISNPETILRETEFLE